MDPLPFCNFSRNCDFLPLTIDCCKRTKYATFGIVATVAISILILSSLFIAAHHGAHLSHIKHLAVHVPKQISYLLFAASVVLLTIDVLGLILLKRSVRARSYSDQELNERETRKEIENFNIPSKTPPLHYWPHIQLPYTDDYGTFLPPIYTVYVKHQDGTDSLEGFKSPEEQAAYILRLGNKYRNALSDEIKKLVFEDPSIRGIEKNHYFPFEIRVDKQLYFGFSYALVDNQPLILHFNSKEEKSKKLEEAPFNKLINAQDGLKNS